ncbi:FeoB-associated Cys-rich membrane protein [Paenibacillus sp. 7124]|uniref:FeoB-associated Cys-rich membrane protein n=1 Tax=Paenibacillus apii TaxID=1850370 RepID=A0A6M1PH37_9BACL|nr:FeoB-associated Cys-rich membrane protein [Paenibacillus apii]NGM82536.1 FeoB-associated Cys-rich membrane protein [Paenibacillus apii]NJJ39677.1 FeoB-associated Cys-rich membrane protein [Paenibacillus apii]
MLINTLIAGAIFGYSGWILYRHVQKGKKGACAGCDKGKSCEAASMNSPLSCCGPGNNNVPPAGMQHSSQAGL